MKDDENKNAYGPGFIGMAQKMMEETEKIVEKMRWDLFMKRYDSKKGVWRLKSPKERIFKRDGFSKK